MERVCLFSQRKARKIARMSSRERPDGVCVCLSKIQMQGRATLTHRIYTNNILCDTTTPSSGWSFGSTKVPSVTSISHGSISAG